MTEPFGPSPPSPQRMTRPTLEFLKMDVSKCMASSALPLKQRQGVIFCMATESLCVADGERKEWPRQVVECDGRFSTLAGGQVAPPSGLSTFWIFVRPEGAIMLS